MGKDKWDKVIKYLRSSNRDPDKVLKLLQGNQKGKETNYDRNRSSYALNVIAVITQKILDPKNKGKSRSHIIRQWVISEDFENFYNLLRQEEKLVWSRDKANEYVKQINDLWNKPNQKHWRKYFEMTKGKFITGSGSGIGKRKITEKLMGVSQEIIDQAIPKIRKYKKSKIN